MKAQSDLGPGVLAVRAGAFQEDRAAGEIGADARERGDFASATYAAPPTDQGWAWRLQSWLRQSNLYNTSVSIALNRQSTPPPTTSIRRRPPATASTARCAGRAPVTISSSAATCERPKATTTSCSTMSPAH